MNTTKRVVQEIQERLSAGSLASGSRLPSERALAVEFRASRTVIQSAIRELERQGLVVRRPNHRPIIQRPTPNGLAGTTKAPDQIGIWILHDLQDLGGMMILQGIRSVFGKGGYRLLIAGPPSSDRDVIELSEVEFLRELGTSRDVAGAIVWDTGNPRSVAVYRDLVDAKVPLVFIDREPPFNVNADVVSCNNRWAARNAVQHLLDLGHRRISIVIGSDRASSVRDRIEGYRRALEECGVTPSPVLDIPCDGVNDSMAEAERFLTQTLESADAPSALFAVNDRIAMLLSEAAKNLRIPVPERLSILGFDWLLRGTPAAGQITTVSQPFEEIGRVAAQRLLDRIARNDSEIAREILLSAPLIVGASTGPPSANSASASSRISGDPNEKAQSVYSY